MGDKIPNDVLHQVLARLPVKSLLRFRSVCKTWNALITTDSHFINSQHQHQHLSHSQQLLVHGLTKIFRSRDLQEVTSSCDWWQSLDDHTLRTTKIVCFYQGLILFKVIPPEEYIIDMDTHVDHHLKLWNPSIRKFKLFSYRHKPFPLASHGICYDPLVDSYKVVVLLAAHCTDILVYNVSTDAWSMVNEPFFHILCYLEAVSVNGLLHCVCQRGFEKSSPMVVAYFDLLEARLKEVPQPDYGDDGHGQFHRIGLADLKGDLCIYSFPESKQEIKFWLRKEKSWTIFVVIPYIGYIYGSSRVLSLTEEGEVLMELGRATFVELVFFSNSENRSTTVSTSPGSGPWSLIYTRVDSLILIDFLQEPI